MALAFPRVGLSAIALIGSFSPSKALFTTKAIKSSVFAKDGSTGLEIWPDALAAEPGFPLSTGSSVKAFIKRPGRPPPFRFVCMSNAFAMPRVGLSGIALIKSMLSSRPAWTARAMIASRLYCGPESCDAVLASFCSSISSGIKYPKLSRIFDFVFEKPHNVIQEKSPRLDRRQVTDVPLDVGSRLKITISLCTGL